MDRKCGCSWRSRRYIFAGMHSNPRPPEPILVTGSAGRLGLAVVTEFLRLGWGVRGFDRVATPPLPHSTVGSITSPELLIQAATGTGSIIHLAATPDDADFLAELLPNNITGLYHVMEAARLAGVRRLVLASSGQVNWFQRQRGPLPVQVSDMTTPRYWYAATKVFMEAIGQSYAEKHGISVIVARLGWCPRDRAQAEEIAATPWAQDVYLSPVDAGRFFAAAITAPLNVPFSIVYATSKPRHQNYYDLTPTQTLTGFSPAESWPTGNGFI